MNFNLINRNSLMSGLYTDRPAYNFATSHVEEQHLNPSKSKVNIRQSLNKTTENSTANTTINSARNSCLLNNSLIEYTHRQQTPNDLVFKSKENQLPFVQKYRDNFGRYNSVMPSPNFNEERRKCDSVHHRTVSRQEYALKFQEQKPEQKNGNTEQVRAQIATLAKRVSANEEEIARLKQRNGKDKKWQSLQSQLSEYRSKMVEYYKFNSNHFNQIQSKMQNYQHQLGELREKCFRQGQNQKSHSCHSVEKELRELYEQFRKRESSVNQLLIKQTTNMETSINKWANNQINILNARLEKTSESFSAMHRKLSKMQQAYDEKKKKQDYKRSHKKCSNSLSFEKKEVLVVKDEGQSFREKAKPSNYYDPPSKRQYYDQTTKKDYGGRRETLEQPKRELIIKQKTYYIDSEGYLLDENKYYLLDSQNQQILIPEHIIACLKDNHILTKK